MNCKISRLLGLFVVMFTMSMPTLASSHYSKAVATAVGEGKVYASNSQTNSPAYTDGLSEATYNSKSQTAPTHYYYLYAQANEGNVFAGWYEDAECSGTAASTDASYTVSFAAESTNQSSPTTKTFYAKFVSASAPTESDEVTLTDGEAITDLSAYAGQEVSVNYKRDFTNGTASTVCLPFAYTKKAADGSFYAFTGIEKVGSDYVATMTEPGATTLEANTPYLYLPNATGGVDFSGIYTIPATLTAGETTVGDWTFKGTYTTIEWETAPTGIYGFAGQTAGGVSQGQFVKVGAYVRIKPLRCYLENASFAGARGANRAAEQLPETIQVRLVSTNGEVTGIGTISTKTGEVTMDKDAWYSLDGRREMNPAKGVYIKNGNKVVIK